MPYGVIEWSKLALVMDILDENLPIAHKFDVHLGSSPAEMPVKLQSDVIFITTNLAASKRYEILR